MEALAEYKTKQQAISHLETEYLTSWLCQEYICYDEATQFSFKNALIRNLSVLRNYVDCQCCFSMEENKNSNFNST